MKSLGVRLGLILTVAGFTNSPAALQAQENDGAASQKMTYIEFAQGGPQADGFHRAAVLLEYQFYSCNGGVLLSFGLQPGRETWGGGYWYQGVNYDIGSQRPDIQNARMQGRVFAGGAFFRGVSRVADIADVEVDCTGGGNNHYTVDVLPQHIDRTNRSAIEIFLNSLNLDLDQLDHTFRDRAIEQELAQRVQAAQLAQQEEQRAREEAERRRLAQLEQERVERLHAQQQQQQRDGAAAGQQSAGGGESQQSTTSGATQAPAPDPAVAEAERQRLAEEERQRQAQAEYDAEMARQEAERIAQEKEAEAVGDFVGTMGEFAIASQGILGVYYFSGSGFDIHEQVSGVAIGIDWKHFYVDFGMLSGTYSSYKIEDYADEYFGAALEPEFEGYFMDAGLGVDLGDEVFGWGFYAGMLFGTTPQSELTVYQLGTSVRWGGFKVRGDFGMGSEVFSFGVGVGLQMF